MSALRPGVCVGLAWLYVVAVILILSAISHGKTVYRYTPTTQTWNYEWVRTNATIPAVGANIPNGTYRIIWTMHRSGTTSWTGNQADFTVQNGVVTSHPGTFNFWAGTDTRFLDQGRTYTIEFPATAYRVGYGNTIPVQVGGELSFDVQTKAQNNPAKPPDVNLNIQIALGTTLADPCPPRSNLTFKLNANMPSSGTYNVSLEIDGASVYGAQHQNGTVGAGSTTFTATGINTASGQFSYAWKVNGVTKASGSVTCGQEIPNNTITHTVDTGPAEPLIPEDPDAPPDLEPTPKPEDPNTGEVPKGGPVTPEAPPPASPNGPAPAPGNFTGAGEQEDIYQAVRKALGDSGNEQTKPELNKDEPEDGSAHLAERGKLDLLQEELSQGVYDAGQAKSLFASKFVAFADVNLPTSIGTVTAINFGDLHYASKTVPLKMDFAQWQDMISTGRTAVLWIFGIVWVFSMVWMVRSYI